jgi:oligoribonuclease (3'-5' exoribonuclease)
MSSPLHGVTFRKQLKEYEQFFTKTSSFGGRVFSLFSDSIDETYKKAADAVILLKNNNSSITSKDLPTLQAIMTALARLNYPIFVDKIKQIYSQHYDLQSPHLLIKKLQEGDILKARSELTQLLQFDDPEVQYHFWSSLDYSQLEKLHRLCDSALPPLDHVQALRFVEIADDRRIAFQAKMIIACRKELSYLECALHRGVLDQTLIAAIFICENLEVLDISHFCLASPSKTLTELCKHPRLSSLHLRLRFSPELLMLPKSLFQAIKTLYVVREENENESYQRGLEKFVSKCTNLTQFCVESSSEAPLIPKNIESLQLANRIQNPLKVLKKFQHNALSKLSLCVHYRAEDISAINELAKTLTSLQITLLGSSSDKKDLFIPALNIDSSIQRLTLSAYSTFALYKIKPFLAAANPTELFLANLQHPKKQKITHINVDIATLGNSKYLVLSLKNEHLSLRKKETKDKPTDNHMEPTELDFRERISLGDYPRLKRVLLSCDVNWVLSEILKQISYSSYTVELHGEPKKVLVIDLADL